MLPGLPIDPDFPSLESSFEVDERRQSGKEIRYRDRTRRGLRKGNGGDTGRNDEHKEVIVTKRNQFFLSKTT